MSSRRVEVGAQYSCFPMQGNRLIKPTESFKIQIPFAQLRTILEVKDNDKQMSIIISFDQPCVFYRRTHNIDATHDGGRRWNDRKLWYRQTDISLDHRKHRDLPIELRKRESIIDIGMYRTRVSRSVTNLTIPTRPVDNLSIRFRPRRTKIILHNDQRSPQRLQCGV